jgi:hypothetical protein
LHKTTYFLFAVLSASILIPATGAQTRESLPKHGAEHEKLAYFLGKWVYEEDVNQLLLVTVENIRIPNRANGSQASLPLSATCITITARS